jgi:hypothetical protein
MNSFEFSRLQSKLMVEQEIYDDVKLFEGLKAHGILATQPGTCTVARIEFIFDWAANAGRKDLADRCLALLS